MNKTQIVKETFIVNLFGGTCGMFVRNGCVQFTRTRLRGTCRCCSNMRQGRQRIVLHLQRLRQVV